MIKNTIIAPGHRINFTIMRVATDDNGTPCGGYYRAKYSGVVKEVEQNGRNPMYTVAVKNKSGYFKISNNQITHIWRVV